MIDYLGDKTWNLTAIYHRPESEYAYLYKEGRYISELEQKKK